MPSVTEMVAACCQPSPHPLLLPDLTSTRFAAVLAVVGWIAGDASGDTPHVLLLVDADDFAEMPTEVRTHGELRGLDPESSPVVLLPAGVLARYALGRPVEPLSREEDF